MHDKQMWKQEPVSVSIISNHVQTEVSYCSRPSPCTTALRFYPMFQDCRIKLVT